MEKFELFGRKIKADYDVRNYGIIRKDYLQTASEMCEAFSAFWKKNCDDMHDVVEYCPRFFDSTISMLVKGAVSNLIANKIYDMDEDSFYDKYKHKYFDCSFFDKIAKEYDDIMSSKDKSYASARRDYEYNSTSSHRWSGGGFGLVGAAKGAITASVLNFAADSIASSRASKNYDKQIKEVNSFYDNELRKLYNTVYSLVDENIWNICVNCMYAYMDELEYNEKLEYPDLNKKKASTIYSNSLKHAKDDELIENLLDCIKCWPFEEEYFITLYKLNKTTDKDAETIDKMVEFYQLGDSFYEKTEDVRKNRIVKNILKKMSESKKLSLIDKARFVSECFEKSYYGSDILNENDKQKLLKFVNDGAKQVVAEIENSKGDNQKEKIKNYISENKLANSDEKVIQVSFACVEISKKYPFFETLNTEEYNLVLDESYLEFLNKVKALFDLSGGKPENAPMALKNMLEGRLMYHWMVDAMDEESIECFDKIQKAYKKTFAGIEKISSKVINERKNNLVKLKEGEIKLKEKYDEKVKEDNINVEFLTQLMKDVKQLIPNDLTSLIADEYKNIVAEAITKDVKALSVIDLYQLQRTLLSYNDPVLTVKGQQVKTYFLTVIGEKESEYDDDAFRTYVDEAIKLEKKCKNATPKELSTIIKKLNKLPECVSGTAIVKAQKLYDKKIKEQENEFKELTKDYENKSETELKKILEKIDEYPSDLTENVKPEIENLISVREKEGKIKKLTKKVDNLSISELEKVLTKLKEFPVELAGDEIKKVEGIINERSEAGLKQIKSISDNIDTVSYEELCKAYSTVSNNSELPENSKADALEIIEKRLVSKGDEIAKSIHNDIRNRYTQYSSIYKYFNFVMPSKPGSKIEVVLKAALKNDKKDWHCVPILRVLDLYSKSDIEKGLSSKEGILFLSHSIIVYTDSGLRVVPIKDTTTFAVKKRFLGRDIILGDINIRFTCISGIEEDEMAKILNVLLEKIRQSEFYKGSVKKAPKVEAPKVAAPKVEAPKVEVPKVAAPKVEAPKVEAPKVETPQPIAVVKESNSREKLEKQIYEMMTLFRDSTSLPGLSFKGYSLFADNVRKIEKFLKYVDKDEYPLFIYDSTILLTNKKGFMFTNKRVYDLSERSNINISDIIDVNLYNPSYISFEIAGGRIYTIKASIASTEDKRKAVYELLMNSIKLIRGEAQSDIANKDKPEAEKAYFCPKCGSPIKEGALFCGKCGNKL